MLNSDIFILLCRFSHSKHPLCYSYGEKLATMLCKVLKELFPPIFEHLEAVWIREGMPMNEGRVGGAPFTTMCITRDYSCNPHNDEHDNSFGFFIWLGSDGKLKFYIQLIYSLLNFFHYVMFFLLNYFVLNNLLFW